MEKSLENFQEKTAKTNCGKESCACAETSSQEPKKIETKQEEKLDPTHFGDWQVNCRAIDF